MQLYLIRHAQSQNNALPQHERIEDPPLTDMGIQQARCLADWIDCEKFTRLITSPFLRTLETAKAIHETTGLVPEIWVELHELGGCYSGHVLDNIVGRPGLTRSDISNRFPGFQIPDEIDGDGWWGSKPHEDVDLAKSRAMKLHRRTIDTFAHTDECVAYVMHGDFKLLFLDCFKAESFEVANNAAVSKITIEEGVARLELFNYTDHLTDDLISR